MNKKKLISSIIIIIGVLYFGIDGMTSDTLTTGSFDYPKENVQENTNPPPKKADSKLQGPYKVIRVVDGDTVIVDIEGIAERVRLIGVDTPESVHPNSEKNIPYGKIASDYTKSKLEGKEVRIEFDVQERDQYSRVLAYVYLDDKMFNMMLLEDGHAKVSTYPPNVKYVDEFTSIQTKAKRDEIGVWKY